MKKILILSALSLFFSFGFAQKIAYVDTQYILKQMPQYQQSEQRLANEVKKWQDEIVKQQSALEKLRIEFENEKVLLTEDQKKTKLYYIDSTDKVLHEFIEKKFGTNGESISLRINFAKPLQDQIWNAINTVSARDKYNIIFDKSSDLIMVFTDSKYDITNKVLKQLGIASKGNEYKSTDSSSQVVSDTDKEVKEKGKKTRESKNKDASKEKQKSGYGRKYVPKKKQNAIEDVPQINEQDNSTIKSSTSKKVVTKINENTVRENETIIKAQQNSGETSQNVPAREVNKEVNKAVETKSTSKSQKKSGYGSKYVPKKKTQNKKEINNIK